ncbi:hypothetical protein PMAYCL1PPCAC_07054 [Pristionchus mayeri]|uniref:Ig-like domain-containing protein n=1 Tax=Pristionchus mayeri TaxID=1317129 RepID=A0AAN5CC43_9BILA|nr:hypothetical protein PMAYCL1PPCAC_07054 [Pristionchus mayeri]
MLAPFFDKAPSLVTLPDGSVLFECLCNANPQPTIQWFFKDKPINDDRHVCKIKKTVGKWTVTMTLKNPSQSDQGVYRVTATNDRGNHSVEQQYVHVMTGKEIFKTQ